MRTRLFCPVTVAIALIAAGCSSSSSNSAPEAGGSTSTWPAARNVTAIEGQRYRQLSDDSARGTVDIYYPADASGDRPLVVLLHGWGSPAVELAPFAEEIAKFGATVFYFRWHTGNGFSADSAADLSCIGGFVSTHAGEYGSSLDRVVVVGHSMGGETGSKLALSSFGLDPSADCVETGDGPSPYAFLGIGGTYGLIAQPLDDELSTFGVRATPLSAVREVASDEFVTPGLTALQAYAIDGYSALPSTNPLRMVLLVGSEDQYTATSSTVTAAFAEALNSHGTDVEVIEVPDANHENVMYIDTTYGQTTLQVVRDLLNTAP